MRTILLFLLTFSLGIANAQRLSVIEVATFEQYEEVLTIAKAKNQLLFIILNETRVPLLGNMIENGVFKEPTLTAELQKTVPCIMEVRDDMGERLVEIFAIDSVPAFLFLDTNETLLAMTQGNESSASVLNTLNRAKQNRTLYPQLQEAYVNQTLSLTQWPQLLAVYTLNRSFIQSQQLVLEYLALQNKMQLLSEPSVKYMMEYGLSLETKYPRFLLEHKEEAKKSYAMFDASQFFTTAYNYNVDLAIANEDSVLLGNVLNILIPLNGASNNDLIKLETKKLYAEETKNFAMYQRAIVDYVRNGKDTLSDSAEFIYDEAFYLADSFKEDEAQKAAKELALEAAKLKADFRYKMLAGYMSYKLGEYDEAKNLVTTAQALTDLESNKSKADNLLKMIGRAQEKKADGVPIGVGK